ALDVATARLVRAVAEVLIVLAVPAPDAGAETHATHFEIRIAESAGPNRRVVRRREAELGPIGAGCVLDEEYERRAGGARRARVAIEEKEFRGSVVIQVHGLEACVDRTARRVIDVQSVRGQHEAYTRHDAYPIGVRQRR